VRNWFSRSAWVVALVSSACGAKQAEMGQSFPRATSAPVTYDEAALPAPSTTDAVPERVATSAAPKTTPSEPPAPPRPPVFEGRQVVTYREFVEALREVADELTSDPDVLEAHAALLQEFALTPEDAPLESFSRVRLVFEAARDGGFWDLRWAITDQMPWSDRIWEQWAARAPELEAALPSLAGEAGPSALAECDELSALFALLVRDMTVKGSVALHWPVWNHVVAVWELPPKDGRRKTRIVVPTSQVFLSRTATLGTRELETQRVLFPYARRDLELGAEIPGPVARYLIGRAQLLGGLSTTQATARRDRLGGS
jgi:hypothetical protein